MPAPFIAMICAAPTMLSIAGVALPVDALTAAPQIAVDAIRHAPKKQLVKDALPIAESIGAAFIPIPCLGLGMQILFFALGKSRPMTPAEEKAWMDRMGIGAYS